MPGPTVADLVFPPQANHNFSRILGDLRRANLSIGNRLRSIRRDATFVELVAAAFAGRPLVANERCGSWYVPPGRKAGSAYFKSTDGHTGQWKFSVRRLNVHLLDMVGRCDGCIIVDSTRRGKSMPDALSKTIPVWCCVLNRALFPDLPDQHELFVPPGAVSASEASQMNALIPGFVRTFQQLELDLAALRRQVTKPLRPIWVTQDDELVSTDRVFESYHPIVCCTSSKRVVGTELSEAGYIQGAGDDTENWAQGLTAALFWEHTDDLLGADEAELPGLITSLVVRSTQKDTIDEDDMKQVFPSVFVASSPVGVAPGPEVCLVSLVPTASKPESWTKFKYNMEVGIGKHKTASRYLRDALPIICPFVLDFLSEGDEAPIMKQVVIACDTGKDLSVGAALAVLCWCFDDDGNLLPRGRPRSFTKDRIRARLSRIMLTMPEAKPSRTTLQSVNSFLMDSRQ